MKRALLIGGAVLALSSTLALAAPESLLPPGFDRPRNTQAPGPRSTPVAPAPRVVPPDTRSGASPVVQPLPDVDDSQVSGPVNLPANFPSIQEIEKMSPDEIDELLGLKPKFDIPPGARRSLSRIGVISRDEGGFPARALAGQPAALVRAALRGTRHELVSRWGHILLRRTLVSRLDAPQGMDAVEFAALRATVLNKMGEGYPARALVQDVDSSNYSAALTNAAFDAYVATGDITGMCPVAELKGDIRKDGEWQLVRAICRSFSGDGSESARDLDRALSRGSAPRIDILLAKRYAGAAADGGQAVNIEWNGVSSLNKWRYSLSVALGIEVPQGIRTGAGPWYDRVAAVSPALPLGDRAAAADLAASEGILSSEAMVDLYSQIFADSEVEGDAAQRAERLREAYVARSSAERMQAIKDLWGTGVAGSGPDYGRLVLTAHAAARISPSEDLEADAPLLIASMLSAGLDRNAMRWAAVVPEGSTGWGLLAIAQPVRQGTVDGDAVDSDIDQDSSSEQRKSQFLVAGLAGLGRLDASTTNALASSLDMNLTRESPWSRMITRAAETHNPALVALLAGLGMQGDSWDMMTPRHLYLIVRSLNQVGLSAEARMIAAEAVARG
ncbi:MAG: hypothetical protein H6R45_6 [Proteobacteria bacterium]|nr:hypothetical protein [Pseudomonadota bacterium]